MPEFNVDTDEVIALTNRLEKLNNSAFPNAVRGTLNGMALDVKKNTMPDEADDSFIIRQKNFFKAHSAVDFARGFDVDSMKSEVGFIERRPRNMAVKNLEEQEEGGTIGGRSFLALHQARISKTITKLVAKRNRISGIKNIVKTSDQKGSSEGQRFIQAVFVAGVGGVVFSKFNGRGMVWRVESLQKNARGRFRLTAIQSYKEGRTVKVKATHFMKKASLRSAKKGDEIYFKEAERQFNKVFK